MLSLTSSSRDASAVLLAALLYATQEVSAEVAAPQASSAMVDLTSPPEGVAAPHSSSAKVAAPQASSATVDLASPRPLPPLRLLSLRQGQPASAQQWL